MKNIDFMMLSIVITVLLIFGLFNIYISYNKEQVTLKKISDTRKELK